MKPIQNPLKIGIPNTLYSAYHLSYWRKLLTLSGMEVILSGDSDKEMADRGGRLLPHEFCIPIKVFMGHILNLLEKGVDQILLPRMMDDKKSNFFCPKLIGLPEIVKFSAPLGETLLFSPEIISNGLKPRITGFSFLSNRSLRRVRMVEKQALECWEQILANCRQNQITLPEAAGGIKTKRPENHPKIGLLGYAYSLYDPFISKGLSGKLQKLKVTATTWEMLEPKVIERALAGLKRPLFWNFGRMLLGAGLHFLEDSAIDGIIYVTAFGCGPDSVATEILSIEAANREKPFLLINLDEHTEDGHLMTRLEAFIDMLNVLKEDPAV